MAKPNYSYQKRQKELAKKKKKEEKTLKKSKASASNASDEILPRVDDDQARDSSEL